MNTSGRRVRAEGEVVVDGLIFPECPRWHDGSLFFTDMFAGRVLRLVEPGRVQEILRVDGDEAAGIGWLPSGHLLAVSSFRKSLVLVSDDGPRVFADLSWVDPVAVNDLVVDGQGRAYVGGFGFDLNAGESPAPAAIACVEPDGTVSLAATGLRFPNGIAIRRDGSLVVAESFGARLTVFDRSASGALSRPRCLAEFPPGWVPDGICVDDDDGVWVTVPSHQRIVRVDVHGSVTDTIELSEGSPYSCVLGGVDGRDLFICVADTHDPVAAARENAGRIVRTRVEIAGHARDGLGG